MIGCAVPATGNLPGLPAAGNLCGQPAACAVLPCLVLPGGRIACGAHMAPTAPQRPDGAAAPRRKARGPRIAGSAR